MLNCLAGIVYNLNYSVEEKFSDAIFNLAKDATGNLFEIHNPSLIQTGT